MMKYTLSRIFSFLLALFLLVSLISIPAYADEAEDIKIRDNLFRDGVGIRVSVSDTLEDPENAFTIVGPDGELTITSVTAEGKIYTIVTQEELDLQKEYTILFNGSEYKVNLPSYYSTQEFEDLYTYTGNDLGYTWTKEKTVFRLWAPTATAVKVNFYESGDPTAPDLSDQQEMNADINGTWVLEVSGDLNGVYYTYQVDFDDDSVEACDPYARTTGVNGQRAMVMDLSSVNPEGWDQDKDPHADNSITDAIIYELHVRDLSVDASSGIQNRGKFLGVIETGTTNPNGIPTGLDHIKNLGVTHIHLLPSYDYGSIDEANLQDNDFNWGYDPQNYNVPEGSYSTDPYNGEVRVAEFKQMVKGLHDNGISVIMDVVYNHVYSAENFCFNKIVPGYFSRISPNGRYSAGSGCGNDTASERAMVQKYIVDSVTYWADEYHIDGFRFDLVGLIDTETVNAVVEAVHKTHPNVIFYGEGWTMSTELTKEGYTMATQSNSTLTPDFAYFSDTIRDAIRGPMNNISKPGFCANGGGFSGAIASCFKGTPSWCKSPTQTINYASCHDNNTLFDRITTSTPDNSFEERVKMNNLAAAIVMTSQGTPLFQAGEEMLRSKPLGDGTYDHNSYRSPDSVNNLKWNDLCNDIYMDTYQYYQGLIAFRKAHPGLRMTSAEEIANHITNLTNNNSNTLAFQISKGANGEEKDMVVIFNAKQEAASITLPEGNWDIYINAEDAGTTSLGSVNGTISVDPISAMVLIRGTDVPGSQLNNTDTPIGTANTYSNTLLVLVITGACVIVALSCVLVAVRRRKQ